ncbi:MAG: phosphatase PAP2 family protein [Deltaproteobacteria bacterium]|jgi:acid phosphatase (class A)|nr:phosphatase PAP2 family protein [Deltaproteobacteria bacterium]
MCFRFVSVHRKLLFSLVCVILLAGCAIIGKPGIFKKTSKTNSEFIMPYLPIDVLPKSSELLPPPPEKNSAAMALDKEMNKDIQKLRGTARWEMAIMDANLKFPEAAQTFSCALNAPITEKDTPHLYILLRRSMIDAGLATFSAKNKYEKKRPFVVNKKLTCVPDQEDSLRESGSYPSGHSSIGWAWALILSELAPDRADAIFARGRAFGESRLVCNVHWHSDVVWGRFVGAATVARLHADPTFCADIEAAKAELGDVWKKGLKPTRDCDAESQALKY